MQTISRQENPSLNDSHVWLIQINIRSSKERKNDLLLETQKKIFLSLFIDCFIPFSERKGYRLLKWVGKSLKTLFVPSNQETVRIIVTNIDHLWSEVSWILAYRAREVRIWCQNINILLLVFSSWSGTNTWNSDFP